MPEKGKPCTVAAAAGKHIWQCGSGNIRTMPRQQQQQQQHLQQCQLWAISMADNPPQPASLRSPTLAPRHFTPVQPLEDHAQFSTTHSLSVLLQVCQFAIRLSLSHFLTHSLCLSVRPSVCLSCLVLRHASLRIASFSSSRIISIFSTYF